MDEDNRVSSWTIHGPEAQLRCLQFIWETVKSISSLHILGASFLWAGTKPGSVGVHEARLVWLQWFINPQGYDFKSSSLKFGWKGKIAYLFI